MFGVFTPLMEGILWSVRDVKCRIRPKPRGEEDNRQWRMLMIRLGLRTFGEVRTSVINDGPFFGTVREQTQVTS